MRGVIFDMVGTLFSLERVEAVLEREGAPADLASCWFPALQETLMASTLSGRYLPFREAAELSLTNLLEIRELNEVSVTHILTTFRELAPYPDARVCLEALASKGLRLAVLTNSTRDVAAALLSVAGVADLFAAVVSADEVSACKPHPSTYRLVLDRLDIEPEEACLVAAHGWDIQGAAAVGMQTVWVCRQKGRWPYSGSPPGLTVSSLAEVPELLGC